MAYSRDVRSLIDVEILVILKRFAEDVLRAGSVEPVKDAMIVALRDIKELYDGE